MFIFYKYLYFQYLVACLYSFFSTLSISNIIEPLYLNFSINNLNLFFINSYTIDYIYQLILHDNNINLILNTNLFLFFQLKQYALINVIYNVNMLGNCYDFVLYKDNNLSTHLPYTGIIIFKYLFKISFLFIFLLKLILVEKLICNKNINYSILTNYNNLSEIEKEFSSLDDILFFIIFLASIFLWFFFSYIFFYTYISKNLVWLFFILILFNLFTFLIPVNLFFDMGISFIVYVRGVGNSTLFIVELIFDIINISIIFIRFFIQNIRFILIFLAFFELFEWTYKNIYFIFFDNLSNMLLNFYGDSNFNYYSYNYKILITIIFLLIQYLYYFIHFLLLFFIQLLIYFLINFLLFFFFYTSTTPVILETYFQKKKFN